MKIVFLEAVQDYGGARISTLELAVRLSEHHNVMILDAYGACKPFVNAVEEKGLELQIAVPRDKPFVINESKSKFKNLIRLAVFIPHWFKLRLIILKMIKEYDADYVIVNNSKVLSFLISSNRKYKIGLFARGWFLPEQISRKDRFLYKLLVDKYACVAEATRQAIYAGQLVPLDSIYVIHNAINVNNLYVGQKKENIDQGEFKILHSGGFLESKGLHVSIEIAKVLKERNFNFKLVITGLIYTGEVSNEYYHKIKELISRYNLENNVELVKNKSNVIEYFADCDVLIHPSATEGLPRVIMEAMALRKPVIANAVGGVTDYILHRYTGFLTNYNNVEDYVEYIELLASNKALYESVSNNAYELVEKTFTAEAQMEGLLKFFK